MFKSLGAALLALAIFTSCLKAKDTGCNYRECDISAPSYEIDSVRSYLVRHGITDTIRNCSGVYYTIVSPGTGPQPDGCSTVTATYGGYVAGSSTSFDTGTHQFPLKDVIVAWRNVVPKVKAGGYVRMYIPPSLGYGGAAIRNNAGTVIIPANSILVFNMHLDSVD